MIDLIDTILVPQGAEYQAVCRGVAQAGIQTIDIVPIPIGLKNSELGIVNNSELFTQSIPQGVLILGLCGSLSPEYSVGDVVLYRGCYSLEGDFLETDSQLTETIYRQLQQQVSLVTGLTSDRPICQAQEKLHLAQIYPTQVVDMEGYSYVQLLQNRGIATTILRVVSDDCLHNIPNLEGAINNGKLNSGKLAIAMLRQPLAAIRLITGSLTGLKTLQKITNNLVRS